ncbi:MAG: efflux RND transporter periplasmic adaptor subunit [Pseudomonadota bacterium]|nr:efflux RND transporter periplasmic adaptor subunit [Pseudomonadota bacterium]
MKRRLIASLVFVLAIALCGGLVWFNFFRDQMIAGFFAKMQPPPQTISAGEVKAVTWTPGINAIGTAKAENGVELAVETGGVVKAIALKSNKQFARGDVLVQLDDAVERADLLDAQAAVKLAEEALQRASTLRTRGYGTDVAYDQAVAQLAAARSRIARLEAQIEQKALKAPFAGVAGIARVDLGQYVQPGTVVATFQDLSSLKVDFTVPEQMAGEVKLGQPVRFGLTEGDWTLAGHITGIDPRVDPQTRLISVQAVISDNKEQRVLPGQFVRVRVELPAKPNVLTVPQTAVVPSLYGDYVYVIEAEEKDGATREVARQVFVKVGRREGGVSEVLSGVTAGQKVAVSGQNKLQAGSPVKINNSIDVTQAALTR